MIVLCYQNPDDGSKINDREVQKNIHIKSKGQCYCLIGYLSEQAYLTDDLIFNHKQP